MDSLIRSCLGSDSLWQLWQPCQQPLAAAHQPARDAILPATPPTPRQLFSEPFYDFMGSWEVFNVFFFSCLGYDSLWQLWQASGSSGNSQQPTSE